MKKTLITLAALAAASVASAATLDFSQIDTAGSFTLGDGLTQNEDGSYTIQFAGDGNDTLILTGKTKVENNVLSYGNVTVYIKNAAGNDANLFGDHNGGAGALQGGTINFSKVGELDIYQTYDLSMGSMGLTFSAELDILQVVMGSATKVVTETRTLLTNYTTWGNYPGPWNVTYGDGMNHSFEFTSNTSDIAAVNKGALGETQSMAAYKAGEYTYCMANGGASMVVRYNALVVPEPATATLSLLALAGLAARRRRK